MRETTDKPNIFKYATKELSQDAVICWLIEWAYHHEPGYESLRECGQKFVEALFAKHDIKVPQHLEKKPKVWTQDSNIDVLARIGDYVLLVEDKTGTKDHSGQLNRYYKKVLEGSTQAGKVDNGNILPIYLKTGNQSFFDHLRIEHSSSHEIDLDAGKIYPTPYKIFDRREFLNVVEPYYNKTHPMLDDFSDYLKCLDNDTHSYKKWRENEQWEENSWSWQGFFRELERHLVVADRENSKVGFYNNSGNDYSSLRESWKSDWEKENPWGWNWVNNPAGGFAGFWWYYKKYISNGNEVQLYPQVEISLKNPNSRKLCFKVYTDKKDRHIAQVCQKSILASGGSFVCEPYRIRTGYTMTIAQWDDSHRPWLAFDPEGGQTYQQPSKI